MLAMTLHNFPEGMAVGVSFGGGDLGSVTALAIGIGPQNIPERLAIALPLRYGGLSRAEHSSGDSSRRLWNRPLVCWAPLSC
jgi:ZIP family zinc transporter